LIYSSGLTSTENIANLINISIFENSKNMREYYVIGPYQLGSKTGKSWVVGIPSEVAKVLQISTSTLFALRIQKDSRSITLQKINEVIERYNSTMSFYRKNSMAPVSEATAAGKCSIGGE
jgi:hypothetical protein